MCTLTVVPLPGGRVRLAFNRDEQRTRPPGRPPTRQRFGLREAVLPTDPVSGGTWLAVNDAGLALALLNANPSDTGVRIAPGRSRGEIIPTLLECTSPAGALGAFERAIHYPDFAPFRLVLAGNGLAADVRWDGRQSMVMNRLLGGTPLLFTSSGLGDHLVEGVRRELFDDLFAGPDGGWEAAQDAFHRHRWPDRPHLSVNMERADTRTVSYAVIELGPAAATLAYHPDAPDRPAEREFVHLPFAAAGVP
jgi:hypothetical protein